MLTQLSRNSLTKSITEYGAPAAASTAKIRVFDDVRYGKVRYIGVLRTTHYALLALVISWGEQSVTLLILVART
jgi:hypothetical protein